MGVYIWLVTMVNPVLDSQTVKIVERLVFVSLEPHVSRFNPNIDVVTNKLESELWIWHANGWSWYHHCTIEINVYKANNNTFFLVHHIMQVTAM